MLGDFTAKYRKLSSGYMGQILEWPEVVTEGKTIDECKEMLEDAVREMMLAYIKLRKEIPINRITANELCKQAGLKPKY